MVESVADREVEGRGAAAFGVTSLGSDCEPGRAYLLTVRLLHDLPTRLAHSLLAGHQADRIRATVPEKDRELLVCAALLHDIGYSPSLIRTGFHPLDGANYLMLSGAPQRLAGLIAHHSESRLLAGNRHRADLSRFVREEGPVTDALVYADMTAGPSGQLMTVSDRLADIERRHADEAQDELAARRLRVPYLLAAVARVRLRMEARAEMAVTGCGTGG